jgi:DNA-directed RNA polymerase subunit RPC12/RpoP
MSNNTVVTEAELRNFTYPCSDCGKPESNADTVVNQWLYDVLRDAYLCQSCHKNYDTTSYDEEQGYRYLPFYITKWGRPDVKWTEEWI